MPTDGSLTDELKELPTPLIPTEDAFPIEPFWKNEKFGAILSTSSIVEIFFDTRSFSV